VNFVSAQDCADILEIAESGNMTYASVTHLGQLTFDDTYLQKHIDMNFDLPLLIEMQSQKKNFKMWIDCVNSTGGIFCPALLRALGVEDIVELYCEPTGHFPHIRNHCLKIY